MFGLWTRVVDRLSGESRRERLRSELANLLYADEPLHVADVGALWGLQPELAPFAHRTDAIGFDPDEEECARLNERAQREELEQRFLPYAITGADGTRVLNVTRKAASSSLLEPNQPYFDRYPEAERMHVERREQIEVRALGRVLDELDFDPEFLKLDAHGVEAEILGSLSRGHWSSLLAVFVELLFAPHYEGQSRFGEIDDILQENGFELFSLKRYSRRRSTFDARAHISRGQLAFADGLYLRTRAVAESARSRLGGIAAAFGHHDYAYELLSSSQPQAADLVLRLARRPRGLLPARLAALGDAARAGFGRDPGPWSSDGPGDWL